MDGSQLNAQQNSAPDWGDVDPNKYIQIWIRFSSGNVEVKNGGDSWDANH
jgi:hypothetical protein